MPARVVVVGAGFGGLAVVHALRDIDVEVTLVDRDNYHLFQPLLYQVASAVLNPSDIAHPVRAILRHIPNCDFRLAEATGVDPDRHVLHTSNGEIGYEHLVLAAGSANNYFGNQALASSACGLKTMGEALALRSRVLEAFEAASRTRDEAEQQALLTFVIVGAGPTGVEFAGALSELAYAVLDRDFPHLDTGRVGIVLVEAGDAVLGGFASGLGRRARAALRRKRVRVLLRHGVVDVRGREVVFSTGERLAAATVVWTAGVSAQSLPEVRGVERVHQSRLAVSPETLEVTGHRNLYAIGDLAACPGPSGQPYQMLAPVAIQQGRHVARVIAARERGQAGPGRFRYRDKGTMATVGRNVAVAQIGPLRLSGLLGWVTWLFVHLMYLVSFRSRLLVLIGWAWNYLLYDRPVRLIITPAAPPPKAPQIERAGSGGAVGGR